MDPRHELGRLAEDRAAVWFLRREGGRLLERNFRTPGGELDLVFEVTGSGGPELVFVEVRARAAGGWVAGHESVTAPKRRRLARTIQLYLARYHGPAKSARFDILGWDGRAWQHLRNIWPLS